MRNMQDIKDLREDFWELIRKKRKGKNPFSFSELYKMRRMADSEMEAVRIASEVSYIVGYWHGIEASREGAQA